MFFLPVLRFVHNKRSVDLLQLIHAVSALEDLKICGGFDQHYIAVFIGLEVKKARGLLACADAALKCGDLMLFVIRGRVVFLLTENHLKLPP